MVKQTADKNRQKSGTMCLDKFLGEMGHDTCSQIKDMTKRGRIQANGQVVEATDLKTHPDADQVTVGGVLVGYVKMEYYMLNRPQGVVSVRTDSHYETVVGLIGDALRQDPFPAERLDVDTEGFLLITSDKEMVHNLLSPKKHVDKVYMARLSGTLPKDAAKHLEEGILLEDGTRTLPVEFEYAGEDKGQEVLLTIREGKFHQVKRMFEALGCQVIYLKRLSTGSLSLDLDLEPGGYRLLSEKEIRSLKSCRNQKKLDQLKRKWKRQN